MGILLCRAGLVLSLAGCMAACAVTSQEGERLRPGSAAFADYVEAVFRRQNEVAIDLGFALDEAEPDSARYAELEAAESALLLACDGLNELAIASRSGDSPSGPGALRQAREAPACERATTNAAALL